MSEMKRSAIGEKKVLVIGTTGHRALPFDMALIVNVDSALRELMVRRGRIEVLSPLAEGADRLLARQLMEKGTDTVLSVLLPMDMEDYMMDFESEGSRLEFRSLVQRARTVDIVDISSRMDDTSSPEEIRVLAYEACGHQMVDRCDILIALWDGRSAKGRGGTGEVVEYAREVGKPLLWIHTTPPYKVCRERMDLE